VFKRLAVSGARRIKSLIFNSNVVFSPGVLVKNRDMPAEQKYARIEFERRFLLDRFPRDVVVTRVRRISDRYIEDTTLRLRQQSDNDGPTVFKLTQKLGDKADGACQGHITSMYLTNVEFSVLAKLPAKVLTKTRYSVPPFGIDVFDGVLSGLVLAEAEFNSAAEAAALALPPFIGQEVSDNPRFTGGHLVTASRRELENWLAQHGIKLNSLTD
jgi:CYTH domain-containing protein